MLFLLSQFSRSALASLAITLGKDPLLATIFKLIKGSINLFPDNFAIPNHNHRAVGFRGSPTYAFRSPTQGHLSTDKVWVSWFLGRFLILRIHRDLPLS